MIHEDGDVLGRGRNVSQRSRVPTRLRWSVFGSCLVVAGCGAAPDAATTSGGEHVAQTTQALPAAPDASLLVLNKCVEVPSFSNTDGTDVQINDCTHNNNQQWVFPGDGTVRPAFNMSKCLDLP